LRAALGASRTLSSAAMATSETTIAICSLADVGVLVFCFSLLVFCCKMRFDLQLIDGLNHFASVFFLILLFVFVV
jgi:hypothetical protein